MILYETGASRWDLEGYERVSYDACNSLMLYPHSLFNVYILNIS